MTATTAADPLPSWNEGPAKQGILAFVARVTDEKSPDFLPPAERIAVYDNDGTLWPENPLPFQAAFAFDELKRRVPAEPALTEDPMVQAALAGDFAKLLQGEHLDGLLHVLALTHAGMTVDEFRDAVAAWLTSARHPRVRQALRRTHLHTHAGTPALPGGQRLQELHRFRRRRRGLHARLGGACLRHPTGAGCRLDRTDDIRAVRQWTGAD